MKFIRPQYQFTCYLILIACLFTSTIFASTLKAHTEPTHVAPGELFEFILELDENAPPGLPDFNPLAHDFYIHGTAHSTSYMFINGQSKSSTRWVVTLAPKHTGTITIPAIQVGSARSRPITLHVTNHPQTTSQQTTAASPEPFDPELFIKTKLSLSNPFVNQQVIYTVKIFHASSILDAAYQPPRLGDALIVSLGTNRQYQVIEKGRPYLVEEQKYAFFPQKTGHHIIFPPKFQALIYDDLPRRAEAHARSAELEVKPIPAPFTGNSWLPAKAVSIRETYSESNTRLTEGTTLTRTITLKAIGLPAELLPALEMNQTNTFKIYPERPTLTNSADGDDVVGKAALRINYLLNHPGTIRIPEQKIIWFNTETQQQSEIILPARTLEVIAEINRTPVASADTLPPLASESVTQPEISQKPVHSFYRALFFHLILLSVFSCLGLIVWGSRQHTFASIKKPDRLSKHLNLLKKACFSNQPDTARTALLTWARLMWPKANILNLDDVVRAASHPEVTEAIHALSETLYRPQKTTSWQGKTLWFAIQAMLKLNRTQSKKAPKKSALPSINPK